MKKIESSKDLRDLTQKSESKIESNNLEKDGTSIIGSYIDTQGPGLRWSKVQTIVT